MKMTKIASFHLGSLVLRVMDVKCEVKQMVLLDKSSSTSVNTHPNHKNISERQDKASLFSVSLLLVTAIRNTY